MFFPYRLHLNALHRLLKPLQRSLRFVAGLGIALEEKVIELEVVSHHIQEVLQAITEQGMQPAGPLVAHHHRRPTDTFEFEIGFPVPRDRAAGDIGGYHCWVQLYLPERGWVPIDASEAARHPEQRELLYGTQPTDRIHFTTGRDLVLSAGSAAMPLNYFIYPYVELGGKPWRTDLQTAFSYRELSPG